MKKIPLHGKYSKGDVVLVDDEDYSFLSKFRWNVFKNSDTGKKYAACVVYLHRLVMDMPELPVDHINGDSLNNCKINLRTCTITENNRNRSKPRTWRGNQRVTSFYKGVSVYPNGKFQAKIWVGKQLHLGYFTSEIDAARVYDRFAFIYFGQYAKLNFPRSVWGIGGV